MVGDDLFRRKFRFPLQEGDQGAMRVDDMANLFALHNAENAVGEQRRGQAVQRSLQILVSSQIPDRPMKFKVVTGTQARRCGFGLFDAIQHLEQLRFLLAGEFRPAKPESFSLQDQPNTVDLLNILVFQMDNEHAAPRAVQNQPLLLQLLKRLANRRAADMQVSRQLAFIQAFARLELSTEDRFCQDSCDILFERADGNRGKETRFRHGNKRLQYKPMKFTYCRQ